MMETDVLVTGAGPTGLALGCTLAARGVDVTLIDANAAGANTSRAAVVHARTLEVLDSLQVSAQLRELGVVVPHFTVRDRDRVLLSVSFDDLPTPHPYTIMVPQSTTERVLEQRFEQLGGKVLRRHTLQAMAVEADRAHATVADPAGSASQINARYLVGADGMHSKVRETLGVDFAGSRYADSFVLADVRMRWPLSRAEVQLFFSPAGLVVVAPLPGTDHYRVVATVADAPEQPGIELVSELLERRGPSRSVEVTDLIWSSRFRVHHRIAAAYRRGPVFLAGDAAHVHSPAGGQGMNTGIQDAVKLGGLLGDVLADGADPAVLDDYERTRRPVAAGVLATTDRMTKAATVRNAPVRLLRNAVLRTAGKVPAVRKALAMNLSELANR